MRSRTSKLPNNCSKTAHLPSSKLSQRNFQPYSSGKMDHLIRTLSGCCISPIQRSRGILIKTFLQNNFRRLTRIIPTALHTNGTSHSRNRTKKSRLIHLLNISTSCTGITISRNYTCDAFNFRKTNVRTSLFINNW